LDYSGLNNTGQQEDNNIVATLSTKRLIVVLCIFLSAIGGIYYGKSANTPKHLSLDIQKSIASFPRQIGGWKYASASRFSRDIEEMLGADAYIDYTYESADDEQVEVLISYFSAMYEGKQFHSPKNCMLGSGWEPLEISRINILWHGKQTPVNFMAVRKGSQILYVIYWVQGRGRLLASEYEERFFRVVDSFIKNRSDAAFVRLILPGTQEDKSRDLALLCQFSTQVAQAVDAILPD